jgi:hypothetical protein
MNIVATMVTGMTTQPGRSNGNFISKLLVRNVPMKYPVYAPTINMSPCAKLISNRTPYTNVYPTAIKAKKLPHCMALIKFWIKKSRVTKSSLQ